jgi:DNA repair exonuclease SbcCD ATPase subunit
MKDVRLIKLSLRNFKGGSIDIDADGHDIDISGDNEAGKTRIADAFNWLLFGKDTQDQANFQIKTLDSDGNVISGDEEHIVEAVLSDGTAKWNLKRVYKENWIRHRGNSEASFEGHKTEYSVNEVPVPERDYKKTVDEICPESVFKLLANPRYFNEVLSTYNGKKTTQTDARRKLLFDICGVDVTDEDVLSGMFPDKESADDYSNMVNILNTRSFDDHRKIAKASQAKINKELETIPARIDEHLLAMDKGMRDADTVQSEIDVARKDLKKNRDALTSIESEIPDLKKKLADAEVIVSARVKLIHDAHNMAHNNKILNHKKRIDEASKKLDAAGNKVSAQKEKQRAIKDQHANLSSEIESLVKALDDLRTSFEEIADRTFTPDVEGICSRCGQTIPEEQQKAAADKALAEFNETMANELKAINEEGQEKKALLELRKKALKECSDELEKSNEKLAELEKEKSDLSKSLQEIIDDAPKETDPAPDGELTKLRRNVETIKGQIDHIKEVGELDTAPAKQAIEGAEKHLESLQAELVKINEREKSNARVDELRASEKNLAKEYERLEYELFLIGEFEKTKTAMIENTINNHFVITKFKLFEKLVNGGIEPVCIATCNGIPYNTMNNASCVNVGIDIQNVLSKFYDTSVVKFIDNSESVTKLLPSSAQTIRLIVSEEDKELRIERR